MKTALSQYIEDLKTGNCKGEDYYIELGKQQIIDAFETGFKDSGLSYIEGKIYYTSTFETDKGTLK